MEARTPVLREPKTSIKRLKCPTCGANNIEYPEDIEPINPFILLLCKTDGKFVAYSAALTATVPGYNAVVKNIPGKCQIDLAVTAKSLR